MDARWIGCLAAHGVAPALGPAIGGAVAAEPTREETLILATIPIGTSFLNATSFNPLPSTNDLRNHLSYLMEPLFCWNNLEGELIPWLATGTAYAPDFRSFTLDLRKGVTWSDGEPLDAGDVVCTLQLLDRSPTLRFDAKLCKRLRSVAKVDSHTVKVELETPFNKIVDQIEALPPNAPEIRGLVRDALHIWLDKVVEAPISQWYRRPLFSTLRWQGWPSPENPYIQPTVAYWPVPLVLQGVQPVR